MLVGRMKCIVRLVVGALLSGAPVLDAGGGEPAGETAGTGELTLSSGRSYTVFSDGLVRTGAQSLLIVSYCAESREPRYLDGASEDIFKAGRLIAERLHQDGVGVLAGLPQGGAGAASDRFDVLYIRLPDGTWQRQVGGVLPLAAASAGGKGCRGPAIDKASMEQARKAADEWVASMDQRLLKQAWASASAYFTRTVPFPKLEEAATSLLDAKGKVLRRSLLSTTAREHSPGSSGQPVVGFDFVSQTDKVTALVERVAVVRVAARTWQIFGCAMY